MTVRTGRLVVSGAAALVAVLYLVASLQLPFGTAAQPGAAVFPTVMAIVLLCASVVVAVEELTASGDRGRVDFPRGRDRIRVVVFFGALVAYAVLIGVLGYLPATLLATAVTVRVLSGRAWWIALVVGVVMAFLADYLFVAVLDVPLPAGLLALLR